MKQTKLRRRRVFRYAILYFVMLVVFVALIVGPVVAGDKIPTDSISILNDFDLVQPAGQDNNDTTAEPTGGPADSTDDDDADEEDLDLDSKLKFLVI